MVIFDFNAETFEHRIAEMPHIAVDGIDDQSMVTRGKVRQERKGDGRKPRRHDDRSCSAFQFIDSLAQGIGRWRAPRCIGVFLAMCFHGPRIGEQHGRCPNHRGIDEAMIIEGVMPRPDQLRVGADGLWRAVVIAHDVLHFFGGDPCGGRAVRGTLKPGIQGAIPVRSGPRESYGLSPATCRSRKGRLSCPQ